MMDHENLVLLKRALLYLKPFLKNVIHVILCIMIASGINLLLPLLNMSLIDNGLVKQNLNIVISYSLLTFFMILAVQGLGILQTKFYATIYAKYQFKLFYAAYNKLMKLKLSYYKHHNSAEIINNLSTDIINVSRISDRSTFLLVDQIFKMVSGIIGLCIISWKLSLLVLCVVPVKYVIVKRLSRYRRETFKKYLEQNRVFYSWFGDIINGIREIKLFTLKKPESRRFVKHQRGILQSNIKLAFVDQYNQCAETILYQALNCVIYILGAILIIKNGISIGGLFSFITYTAYVTGPLSAIINLMYNYSNFIPSAKRYFSFLDEETEGPAKTQPENPKRIAMGTGHIKFENITFSYPERRNVLKNVSFEILPGEKVAIIGANGSGKTTLLNLLLRFYTPDSGTIYYDAANIQTLHLDDYRRNFSVVSQEPFLFNCAIKDNISLNQNGDAGKISQAALKSGATQFIEKLPDGFETMSGPNGSQLSGGEKQKIAVARAFLRDAPVIVFDEATSNFDSLSDDYLNQMIFEAFSDKTIIVISHKSSVLKYMDKVFSLEKGDLISVKEKAEARSR